MSPILSNHDLRNNTTIARLIEGTWIKASAAIEAPIKAVVRGSHEPCVRQCLSCPLHYLARFAEHAVDADNNGPLFYIAILQVDLDTLFVHLDINDRFTGLDPRLLLWEILIKKRNQLAAGEADERICVTNIVWLVKLHGSVTNQRVKSRTTGDFTYRSPNTDHRSVDLITWPFRARRSVWVWSVM